jgi:DNA recombination protein RmuC
VAVGVTSLGVSVLVGVRKKLQEAGNKIEETSRRSRAMGRALRDVEALPAGDSEALLRVTLEPGDADEVARS